MATIDENILNTLKNIEKALKLPQSRTVAGGADQTQRNQAATNSNGSKGDKVFVATTKNTNAFSDAMRGATSSTQRFKKTIERTNMALGSLSNRVNKTSLTRQVRVKTDGINLQVGNLEDTLANLNKTIGDLANPSAISNRLNGPTGLFRQLTSLTAHVRTLNRAFARGSKAPQNSNTTPGVVTPPAGTLNNMGKGGLGGMFAKLFGAPNAPTMNLANQNFGSFIGKVGAGALAMHTLVAAVKNTASTLTKIVTDDIFQILAARGYGTTENLVDLYIDAAKAGMSLSEYTKMMDENINVVSRSGSFENFQKNLSSTSDTLAGFGIFGQEAANLTGSIMSASTAWGVPQEKLSDTINGQIGVFEKLRKTTNITAEGFQELIKTMKDDADIQSELIGLRPAERAARAAQIAESISFGTALSLTTQQQNQVTEALKNNRRATVKQRFMQAGRIRQTGAMIGMGAGETEELARIAMKRAENRTTEENERFMTLNAKQVQGLEARAKQSPGDEFMVQNMQEMRDSAGLTQLDRAATSIGLAQQSGAVNQQDFNKKLGEGAKALGGFITFLEGAGKNPLGNLAGQALGGIVGILGATLGGAIFATTVGNKIANAVRASLAGMGAGPGGLTPHEARRQKRQATVAEGRRKQSAQAARRARGMVGGLADDAGDLVKGGRNWAAGAGVGAKLARVAGPLATAALTLTSAYSLLTDNTAEERAQTDEYKGDVGKVKGEDWGELAGQIVGGAAPALLGPLGLVLSPFTSMLGGWLGKMVGGWFGSESETEKNTKELKKNTEKLRATAAANTITSDPLGSLSANVLQTAKAYADPNIGKAAAVADAAAKKTADTISSAVPSKAKSMDSGTENMHEMIADRVAKGTLTAAAAASKTNGTSMVPAVNSSGSFIAAPASYTQKTVNAGDINKPNPVNVPPPPQPTQSSLLALDAASTTASLNQDQAAALQQLILLMQESNAINGRTTELQERLLRTVTNQSSVSTEVLVGRATKH